MTLILSLGLSLATANYLFDFATLLLNPMTASFLPFIAALVIEIRDRLRLLAKCEHPLLLGGD